MKINQLMALLILLISFQVQAEIEQSILDMKIDKEGIYRVNYSDIISVGVDLTGVSNENISVISNGTVVPVKVYSDNQTTFGSNAYIEFVGKPEDSLYQKGSVYSIVLRENKTIQYSTLTPLVNQQTEIYYLHTDNYNENVAYSFGAPIDDPWFNKRILAVGGVPKSELLDFELNNLVAQSSVSINVNIWGGTDYPESPDHHVIYQLNGQVLDDFRFDGLSSEIRQYQVASNSLSSGSQALEIIVPNDTNTPADVIHIESWDITYPRAFVFDDNSLSFKNVGSSQNSNIIFKHGFEINEPAIVSNIKNFSITNANNENYLVYHVNDNNQVTSYNSLKSDNCDSSVSSISCSLMFSISNMPGQVYVSAESNLLFPELNLPVMLSDINSGRADYLIISHPDFIGDELNTFVSLKQQEYVVKVVDVEQIYAQYAFGNVSADSIASYIQYASNNLGVSYVLLVGGDTYDYKNYLDVGSVSFVPTVYARTGEYISFAPIDAKYADIDDDNIPDINIGRFPVRTEQELTNLIQKIVAYSNKTYEKTSIFAADKFDLSNNYSFTDDAEQLIAVLPQQWQNNITSFNKAFIDEDGLSLAKSKIIDNINQGVALTSFIGHSGPKDWSFSRMFSASDASLLSNSSKPTIVTQWGCWNTYFVSPTEDTLAHAFMLNQNGGAASVLGASTLTKAEHEKALGLLLLNLLTSQEMTLGEATTKAKRAYAITNPTALDVILGWNILGDPSLRL